MSEENKAILGRFIEEVINQKKLEVFDELVSPDAVPHNVPPGTPADFQAWKSMVTMVLGAFPDLKATVEELVAEGDKVVIRANLQGTHKGELMGIPATGKPVSFVATMIDRVSRGKIAEHWEEADMMGIMQQIGVIPSPE